MRADDQSGKAVAPGEEGVLGGLGHRHGEDRAHRRPHRLDRERIGGFPDQDDAARADSVDGADDGAEVAGVANPVERHPDVAIAGAQLLQREELLGEDADHHLRIVAARDRHQHLLGNLEHGAAGRNGSGGNLFHRRIAAPRLGEDERADRPAEVEGVDDQLEPLGHEGILLVAEFLQRQRLDVLDQRIGEACDLLHLADDARIVVSVHLRPPSARTARSIVPGRPTARG